MDLNTFPILKPWTRVKNLTSVYIYSFIYHSIYYIKLHLSLGKFAMCYLPVPLIDCKHWERSMPQTMHFHVPSAYDIILSWEHLLMKFWIHSFIYEFNSSRNAYLLQNTSSDPFYRMTFTDPSVVQRGKKPSKFSGPCLYVYLMHSAHEGRFSLEFWKTDKYDCQYQYKMGQASQLKETDNQLAKREGCVLPWRSSTVKIKQNKPWL